MGIIYTTEYNGVRNKRDLGNTSFEEALTQAWSDVKHHMCDTISLTLTDDSVITNDELLYLITYYGGFPRYNYRPNQSEILQTIRRLREQKRKNIGIMYKTEYNGTKRQFHFVGTCLMDVLRQVADDFSVRNYDTVSLTLEDRGMVITNDELERITKSYMGFPTGLERSEATILSDIKQLQEQKRKDQQRNAESQRKRDQARPIMESRIKRYYASGDVQHLAWMDYIEKHKLWAILCTNSASGTYWEVFVEGRLQPPVHGEKDAENFMLGYFTGENSSW